MKLLFDFFPIIFFFVAYKFFGIFTATFVAIIASVLQVGFFWLKNRRFEFMHFVTLFFVLILGGATLVFHNDIFIKWKPTIVYWILAVCFLCSQFIGEKTILERMLKNKINLPKLIWTRLNLSWIFFFLVVGLTNLIIVYNFDTNFWVNFKLFGVLSMTMVFGFMQSIYISKYLANKVATNSDNF